MPTSDHMGKSVNTTCSSEPRKLPSKLELIPVLAVLTCCTRQFAPVSYEARVYACGSLKKGEVLTPLNTHPSHYGL